MTLSTPPTSKGLSVILVGCWGLLLGTFFVYIVVCDISLAATIPSLTAPLLSLEFSSPPVSYKSSPNSLASKISQRKRSVVFQQAFIRNVTESPVNISSAISSNISNNPNERIGQVLLDNDLQVNDITICRSEECFETGTQNPSLRHQIAEAILLSDIRKNSGGESVMHPKTIHKLSDSFLGIRKVESPEYWRNEAYDSLHRKLLQRPIEAVAKNVIMFLGDGMSVPTITAARVLKGQQVDNLPFGEEGELFMDTFPYSGMSKTFCSDAQVADSACSATAYLCGVKSNSGTIGLTPHATKNNCTAQNDPAYQLSSILAWAQAAGKSTGVVSTARITHASPAGTYANIANRNWENDHEVKNDKWNPDECDDIAEQLILKDPGRNINVILGGGRLQFLPRTKTDPEIGRKGYRRDGKHLIEMWKQGKRGTNYAYVEGKDELLQIDTTNVDYLLGLFSPSHMEYYHEQEKYNDPSLAEMTSVAIEILSKNPNGFFLFVEGARIDHAHHNNQGMRAIWETVELDKAIQKASDMTHKEDTLTLVTADHSHVFSMAGYPPRGNPISGIAEIALDNLPYTTLSYANGPAFKGFVNNKRHNISNDPLNDLKYRQIPNIPRKSETHGGDDVLILSNGPFAHLFTGVQQQSYLPYAIGYASCIGVGPKYCDNVFY